MCACADHTLSLIILTRSQERKGPVVSYVDKMFPPLNIEEETSQECEITGMKEELNSIKNTLEEIKRSLSEKIRPR
jgi:hypothetical protein